MSDDIVERLRAAESAFVYAEGDRLYMVDEWKDSQAEIVRLRAENERLTAERDDIFRTLAAVLMTTGHVRVPESTIVAMRAPKVTRWDQPPHVVYGAEVQP